MTGMFCIVILVTRRFHGSADLTSILNSISNRVVKNKEVVRHLFGSI